MIFQPLQSQAEPKASPRGGGRFSPGDGGGKGVSPRLNGGGAALGRSVAAGGRVAVAEGKPSSNRRWKVGGPSVGTRYAPFQTHFAKKENLRLFDFLLLQHNIVVPAPTRGSFVRVERNASSRIIWSPVVLCVTFVGVDYGTW